MSCEKCGDALEWSKSRSPELKLKLLELSKLKFIADEKKKKLTNELTFHDSDPIEDKIVQINEIKDKIEIIQSDISKLSIKTFEDTITISNSSYKLENLKRYKFNKSKELGLVNSTNQLIISHLQDLKQNVKYLRLKNSLEMFKYFNIHVPSFQHMDIHEFNNFDMKSHQINGIVSIMNIPIPSTFLQSKYHHLLPTELISTVMAYICHLIDCISNVLNIQLLHPVFPFDTFIPTITPCSNLRDMYPLIPVGHEDSQQPQQQVTFPWSSLYDQLIYESPQRTHYTRSGQYYPPSHSSHSSSSSSYKGSKLWNNTNSNINNTHNNQHLRMMTSSSSSSSCVPPTTINSSVYYKRNKENKISSLQSQQQYQQVINQRNIPKNGNKKLLTQSNNTMNNNNMSHIANKKFSSSSNRMGNMNKSTEIQYIKSMKNHTYYKAVQLLQMNIYQLCIDCDLSPETHVFPSCYMMHNLYMLQWKLYTILHTEYGYLNTTTTSAITTTTTSANISISKKSNQTGSSDDKSYICPLQLQQLNQYLLWSQTVSANRFAHSTVGNTDISQGLKYKYYTSRSVQLLQQQQQQQQGNTLTAPPNSHNFHLNNIQNKDKSTMSAVISHQDVAQSIESFMSTSKLSKSSTKSSSEENIITTIKPGTTNRINTTNPTTTNSSVNQSMSTQGNHVNSSSSGNSSNYKPSISNILEPYEELVQSSYVTILPTTSATTSNNMEKYITDNYI